MGREAKTMAASPDPLHWLHEKYVRAQEVLRSQGARRVLLLALKKICRSVLEIRRFFFENDLTQPLPLLQARIPLTIRPLRVEEIETFAAAFRAQGLAPQVVHRR